MEEKGKDEIQKAKLKEAMKLGNMSLGIGLYNKLCPTCRTRIFIAGQYDLKLAQRIRKPLSDKYMKEALTKICPECQKLYKERIE
jgi:hypothetical protein